jgi:hypothetical protein
MSFWNRKKPYVCDRCGREIPPDEEVSVSRGLLPLKWDRLHEECALAIGEVTLEDLRGEPPRDG